MEQSVLRDTVAQAMTLAPSAHNTQPWLFRLKGDAIDVSVDWERHLTVSDPSSRELFISLGCCLFNGIIAAAEGGFVTTVEYFPDGEEKHAPVARLNFAPGQPDQHLRALAPMIDQRRTNRRLYDKKPLTGQERSALRATSDSHVVFVEDRSKIATLAQLIEEGTVATLSRPDFKEELSHWVRNDWTKKPDGMPGYAMGMPAPLSLVSSVMVRIAPIHKQEGPKAKQQMESTSAIAVLIGEDTKQSWLKTGQLLEQLWLEATQAGLAVAPLASAIEANNDIRQKVKSVVGSDKLPQSILRIGRSEAKHLRMSPRRSVKDCLIV